MKILIASLLAAAALSRPVLAQDWAKKALDASPRHQEWVKIQAEGGRTIDAFVVYPETKKKAPVVLVIHENQGLTDWARDVADQVAAAGAIAVAPDLLSGKGPKGGGTADLGGADAAKEAISKLEPAGVMSDLGAAADYAKKLPSADGRLAVAGFCWGGGKAFAFAGRREDLQAAFVFYGPPPAEFASIKAPVYGFYGGDDARITASLPDTAKGMKAAGKKYDTAVYDGAGHGFMRAGEDPAGTPANKKARDAAWKRWRGLLKKL